MNINRDSFSAAFGAACVVLGICVGIFWENPPEPVWWPGGYLVLLGLVFLWPMTGKAFNKEEHIRRVEREHFATVIKEAQQGKPYSQYRAGMLYLRGTGTPQNDEEAFFWLSLASQAGEKDATARRDEVLSRLSAAQAAGIQARIQDWASTRKLL